MSQLFCSVTLLFSALSNQNSKYIDIISECFLYLQACLSCSNVACGRYIEEHAVKHYKETKHPLALEVNEKYAYW